MLYHRDSSSIGNYTATLYTLSVDDASMLVTFPDGKSEYRGETAQHRAAVTNHTVVAEIGVCFKAQITLKAVINRNPTHSI